MRETYVDAYGKHRKKRAEHQERENEKRKEGEKSTLSVIFFRRIIK